MNASSTSQYGDLATQLLNESRRSTATDALLKYNDVLVRSIAREQRQLESLIQKYLAEVDENDNANSPNMPTVLLLQTAILHNKRCLLAYHHHRLERLKELYWGVGGALPLLLKVPSADDQAGEDPYAQTQNIASEIRPKLSPHEVDFLRSYAASLLELRTSAFSSHSSHSQTLTEDVDLLSPIKRPPKGLYVEVRVVRSCGIVHTEQGAIDFRRGHRLLVRRADVEHLIVQGYLEEV